MKNIVLIPCYNRPEFLSVCLELIEQAYLAKDMYYIFQVDVGYDPLVLDVIAKFKFQHEVSFTPKHTYLNKQSYSLLKGYEKAAEYNPKFIFMIEDDVFIADDFFDWHLKSIQNAWASIATRNHNAKLMKPSNDIFKNYNMAEYQSLGVCFQLKSVKEILSYTCEEYFTDPQKYVKKRFPLSKIHPMYSEQDGLIRRIIQLNRRRVVFPNVPRAFHAGFYGKSRGDKPIGTLEERIAQVKFTAFDPDIMKGDSLPEMLVNPIRTPLYAINNKPTEKNIEQVINQEPVTDESFSEVIEIQYLEETMDEQKLPVEWLISQLNLYLSSEQKDQVSHLFQVALKMEKDNQDFSD